MTSFSDVPISYRCECGALTYFPTKDSLFSEIADTFLRKRERGVTCSCGKVTPADVYVYTVESLEEMAIVEYDVTSNRWLETDGGGTIYEGQPPLLSIDEAYAAVAGPRAANRVRQWIVRKQNLDRGRSLRGLKKKRHMKPPGKVYLKPWKDPNSLFCSPKLEEIVRKKLRTGEECKDKV